MPEPARRFTAPPYDQFDDSDRVFDWGGDELFTRMPRPRAVDDAPAPRFQRTAANAPEPRVRAPRALVLLDPPRERRDAAAVDQRSGQGDRRRASQPAAHGMGAPAEQFGLSVVTPAPDSANRGDEPGPTAPGPIDRRDEPDGP